MQKSDIRSIYASFLAVVHLIYRFYHTTYPIDFTRLYEVDRGLKLIKRATNLFYYKTRAIHPVSTIFGTFTPEVRKEMNVSDAGFAPEFTLSQVNIHSKCEPDIGSHLLCI